MNKIVSWFWGGQSARFFKDHKSSILAFNTRGLGIVNGMTVLLAFIYYAFDLNSGASPMLRRSCLFCTLAMLAAYVFYFFYGKKHPRCIRVYWFVLTELVFFFLLLVGPVYDPKHIACFLPVFFMMLPILVIENYYVILSVALVDFAIFGTVTWVCKPHDLAGYDLIDAATCLLLGIMIGHNVLQNRLSEISAYAKLKKQSETELARALALANRDPLTGVKSRAAFESAMTELQNQIDADTALPFSLAVFDLNELKWTNDLHGHEAGDRLLISCCRLICTVFKHSPVFRIGGDEFVVLLTGNDYNDREQLLREFRLARVEGFDHRVVAAGLSDYRTSVDKNTNEVFVRADAEMYRDKAQMKNGGR